MGVVNLVVLGCVLRVYEDLKRSLMFRAFSQSLKTYVKRCLRSVKTRNHCYIGLFSVTVAARLIAKRTVEVSGHQLSVMEPPVVASQSPPGNVIYVENVPKPLLRSVRAHLEDPKNGGGEITDVKPYDKHVQVTFADAQGLPFVLFDFCFINLLKIRQL